MSIHLPPPLITPPPHHHHIHIQCKQRQQSNPHPHPPPIPTPILSPSYPIPSPPPSPSHPIPSLIDPNITYLNHNLTHNAYLYPDLLKLYSDTTLSPTLPQHNPSLSPTLSYSNPSLTQSFPDTNLYQFSPSTYTPTQVQVGVKVERTRGLIPLSPPQKPMSWTSKRTWTCSRNEPMHCWQKHHRMDLNLQRY